MQAIEAQNLQQWIKELEEVNRNETHKTCMRVANTLVHERRTATRTITTALIDGFSSSTRLRKGLSMQSTFATERPRHER